MKTGLKVSFYLLSMWLFSLIVILLSNKIPFYFGRDWEFIGWKKFFEQNLWLPLFFCVVFVYDLFFFLYLKYYKLTGTRELSFEVTNVETMHFEPLAFLASYFIPLVSFAMNDFWQSIVLLILFVAIGIMYISGNMFHINPSLSLLGFKLLKVNGKFQNGELRNGLILLTKDNLSVSDRASYIKMTNIVYYANLFKKNDKRRITE